MEPGRGLHDLYLNVANVISDHGGVTWGKQERLEVKPVHPRSFSRADVRPVCLNRRSYWPEHHCPFDVGHSSGDHPNRSVHNLPWPVPLLCQRRPSTNGKTFGVKLLPTGFQHLLSMASPEHWSV